MYNKDKEITDRTRKRLMEKHTANEFGFWEICGEDSNCDFGGYHHEPLLTRIEGTYSDAVELALSLDGFFSWGAGGSIHKVEFNKLSPGSLARYHALVEKRNQLEEELDKIEAELKRYKE